MEEDHEADHPVLLVVCQDIDLGVARSGELEQTIKDLDLALIQEVDIAEYLDMFILTNVPRSDLGVNLGVDLGVFQEADLVLLLDVPDQERVQDLTQDK